jgi:DNA-binding PadR family transcriptional regulator
LERNVSPVFRHGGLRLYLLKLLDEAPRHGYDVIRLLQDRFMGVYSPSPGTIYPRLARLEEEGLVTHEVIDGKKVYKITDAGREELNRRFDDLADLEEELTASIRDIARELSRDVRETVRNLRDEFTWAVREGGRPSGPERPAGTGDAPGSGDKEAPHSAADGPPGQDAANRAQAEADRIQAEADQAQARADRAQAAADAARSSAARPRDESRSTGSAWSEAAAEAAASSADSPAGAGAEPTTGQAERASAAGGSGSGDAGEAGRTAGASGERAGTGDPTEGGPGGPGGPGGRAGQRGRGWREWAEWAERRDWRDWAAWAENRDWREWAGSQQEWKDRAKASSREWRDWAKASQQEWKDRAKAGQQEWAASRARRRRPETELADDLERLAAAFARELRGVAWQAGSLSEDAVGNLGRILTDALNRIRTEVFRGPDQGEEKR